MLTGYILLDNSNNSQCTNKTKRKNRKVQGMSFDSEVQPANRISVTALRYDGAMLWPRSWNITEEPKCQHVLWKKCLKVVFFIIIFILLLFVLKKVPLHRSRAAVGYLQCKSICDPKRCNSLQMLLTRTESFVLILSIVARLPCCDQLCTVNVGLMLWNEICPFFFFLVFQKQLALFHSKALNYNNSTVPFSCFGVLIMLWMKLPRTHGSTASGRISCVTLSC